MVDIKKLLADVDFVELRKKMDEMNEIKIRKLSAFWESELCKKMIKDMLREKAGFDSEGFGYFPENVVNKFGWQEIAKEDIDLFINTMAHKTVGEPTEYIDPVDVENSNEEDEDDYQDLDIGCHSHVKGGIIVTVLNGQGTIIILKPL